MIQNYPKHKKAREMQQILMEKMMDANLQMTVLLELSDRYVKSVI